MLSVESEWACEAVAIGRARSWTAMQLDPVVMAATRERLNDAVTCVSELITNALEAGSTVLRLALDLRDHTLRVSLTDDASGWPNLKPVNGADAGGRGLMIVAALSRVWGVDATASGKVVWAALDW